MSDKPDNSPQRLDQLSQMIREMLAQSDQQKQNDHYKAIEVEFEHGATDYNGLNSQGMTLLGVVAEVARNGLPHKNLDGGAAGWLLDLLVFGGANPLIHDRALEQFCRDQEFNLSSGILEGLLMRSLSYQAQMNPHIHAVLVNEKGQNPLHVAVATSYPGFIADDLNDKLGRRGMKAWARQVDQDGNLPLHTFWNPQGRARVGLDTQNAEIEVLAHAMAHVWTAHLELLAAGDQQAEYLPNQEGQTARMLREQFQAQGLAVLGNDPAAFVEQARAEIERRRLDRDTPHFTLPAQRSVRL